MDRRRWMIAAPRRRLLRRLQHDLRTDGDAVWNQISVGPVAAADAEIKPTYGGLARQHGVRARRPSELKCHGLADAVQGQRAVRRVTVVPQLAEGRGVELRRRKLRGVEKRL